jgi:hypothetical protein
MKLTGVLSIVATLCLAVPACAQGGARGTTAVEIGGKKVAITYGRPELKGRDLTAQAPVGTTWRVGKDQATEIETSADLDVAGTTLKAGKYSLWARKVGEGQWHLAFHPKTGVWGAPPLTEGYVAELPLTASTAASPVELLTITLTDAGGKAHVAIAWGTSVLSGDLGVK